MTTVSKVIYISDSHLRKPEDNAFRALLKSIEKLVDLQQLDAVLLGGDLSDYRNGFERTLQELSTGLFAGIPIHVISGNHDIWRRYWDSQMNTDYVFFTEMKKICDSIYDVHWAEGKGVIIGNWLVAGTVGWYDYSSKREGPPYVRLMPDEFYRENKKGCSADGIYVDFTKGDRELAQELQENLTAEIDKKLLDRDVEHLAVFTHVPMFASAIQWKDRAWNLGCQYFYNLTLGDRLKQYTELKLVISGHTHRGVEETLETNLATDFKHLVSYADYGNPEAYEIDLHSDGSVTHKRIGMNSRFDKTT